MGYKYTQEQILEAAVEAAWADGLSRLTFGRVARQLGVSDRIVVYYFATKEDLVTAVLGALGEQLQGVLAGALPRSAADHRELARGAWPMLSRPAHDRVFALYFEASGLAASGVEPFRSLAGGLVDAWVQWLGDHVRGTAPRRRAEAEAALALLDGLLLIRQLAGPQAAGRAARALGVA